MAKPKGKGRSKRAHAAETPKKPSRKSKASEPLPGIPRERYDALFGKLREAGFLVRENVPHADWKTHETAPPEGVPEGTPYAFLNEVYNNGWREGAMHRSVSLQIGLGGKPWGKDPLEEYTRRVVELARSVGFATGISRRLPEVWLYVRPPLS